MTQRRTPARAVRAAAVLALALVATGCGGADNGKNAAATGGNWQEAADRTAIIKVATGISPPTMSASFDPLKSLSGGDLQFGRLIYGTLIQQDEQGKPQPGHVESWESPDPETLVLKLREGVTFHDGSPFDADAVKAGLDRNRGKDSPYQASLEAIESVEATDPQTVTLKMSRPATGGMLATLAGREGLIPAPANLKSPKTMDTKPIGAGPFTLEEFRSGNLMKLRAYEGYYDKDHYPYAGMDLSHIIDNVAVRNAVLSGDIDFGFVDNEGLRALESNPNTGVQVNPSSAAYYVNLNMALDNPPLGNLKVRQALNHAFNREAVASAVYGEGSEPKWQTFPKGTPGHDPELDGFYEYDPAKAKRLLAEAGYPNGFKMSMMAFSQGPSARSAEVFKSDLAKVGVEVSIVPGINMTQDYHIDKKTDAGQNWWLPRTDPAMTFLSLYGPVGILNTSKYQNDELDAIVAEAQGETDPAKVDDALKRASRIVVEEALEVGVAYTPSLWGYSSRVKFKDGKLPAVGNVNAGPDYSALYVTK
jgi:ABC-type transport system substrate-binding protein